MKNKFRQLEMMKFNTSAVFEKKRSYNHHSKFSNIMQQHRLTVSSMLVITKNLPFFQCSFWVFCFALCVIYATLSRSEQTNKH